MRGAEVRARRGQEPLRPWPWKNPYLEKDGETDTI